MTHDAERERPVERRLRRALEARAESVTVRDLRPAAPPRATRRWLGSTASRAGLVALAGLATAALACAAYLTLGPEVADPRPVPPAVPPGITSPTPLPTPSAVPSPARSTTPSSQPSISMPANG